MYIADSVMTTIINIVKVGMIAKNTHEERREFPYRFILRFMIILDK